MAIIFLRSSTTFSCTTGFTGALSGVGSNEISAISAFSSPSRCFGISATRAVAVIFCHLEVAIERVTLQELMEAPTVVSWLGRNFSFIRVLMVLVFPAPSAPSVTNLNWLEEREPFFKASLYAFKVF